MNGTPFTAAQASNPNSVDNIAPSSHDGSGKPATDSSTRSHARELTLSGRRASW